jgi:hypothetical protein
MATLKSKQTSIATVRKHLRTVASLPTSLPFHYPLPLNLNVCECVHRRPGNPKSTCYSVLRIRILTPGSGMGKKSRSGFGMNIPDHISESLETIFRVKTTLHSLMRIRIRDPGSGIFLTLDPVSVMEKFGSGCVADPRCLSRIRNTAFISLFLR